MERKEETKIAKMALVNAGFGKENDVRITHGLGSARQFMKVYAKVNHEKECTCKILKNGVLHIEEKCQRKWAVTHQKILDVTLNATGRDWRAGRGHINVILTFTEKEEK